VFARIIDGVIDRLDDNHVYIIAEAGSNWRMGTPKRDREMAQALIDVAVDAGVDAVKFQTYRPETVYAPHAGKSDYLSDAGIHEPIHDVFKDLSMPYEMIPELADYCRPRDIAFMSTPFSIADFEAIDPYTDAHKIASYEISHLRLIELAAASGKPLILSTGASVEEDIAWAVELFRTASDAPLYLMQCTAKYPAPLPSLNLGVIPWLRDRFDAIPGFSDHSRHPTHGPAAATALGARVIEKHYTLDNRLPGPDHAFALTPGELKKMVDAIRATELTLGNGKKVLLEIEREMAAFARRGVQALTDIRTGDTLTEDENVAILRPGKQELGVHPKHLPEILGRTATRDLRAGEGLRTGDWN